MNWVDYHHLWRPASEALSDAALERAWRKVLAHPAIESTALDPPLWRLARIRVEPSDFPFLDSVIHFEPGEPETRFVERLTAARDRTTS
jgi:hypothetical protein